MFVKSPNAVHNVGEERDKWVPNPMANSKTDLDNYYKIGLIIGLAIKLKECVELNLPSILWKFVLSTLGLPEGGKLDWEDIKKIDLNQSACVENILTMSEQDLLYLEEKFTTFVLGKEFELFPLGRDTSLTAENRAEYFVRAKHAVLAVLKKPLEMLRRGLRENLPLDTLRRVSTSLRAA